MSRTRSSYVEAIRPTPAMSLINPGPVDDICQDNAHRVGAPNHHHDSGSGENPMVGRTTAAGTVLDAALMEAVRRRLRADESRYHVHNGFVWVLWQDALAGVVAEVVANFTDHAIAERDALAEDLAWELNARRGAAGGVA